MAARRGCPTSRAMQERAQFPTSSPWRNLPGHATHRHWATITRSSLARSIWAGGESVWHDATFAAASPLYHVAVAEPTLIRMVAPAGGVGSRMHVTASVFDGANPFNS